MPLSAADVNEKLPDLAHAVLHLTQLVEILSTSLDELTQEVQWRNREFTPPVDRTHLPLTWMPLDPTTRDWHPQWGRTPFDSTRSNESAPSPTPTDKPIGDVQMVLREIVSLKHIAAIVVMAMSGEDMVDEELDCWDAAIRWAYEEFDSRVLHESLAQYFEDPRVKVGDSTGEQPTNHRVVAERQHTLFENDGTD